MTSLISTIRAAIRSGAIPHDLEDIEADADADASTSPPPQNEATTTGANMSENTTVAGVAGAATAAIAAAASAGGPDGYKTAMDRMTAILGAEGIKGDGKRMAAALDLAKQSPEMTAEAVVGFVTANVAAASTAMPQQSGKEQDTSYEQQRLAAAGLAQPKAGGVEEPKSKSILANYRAVTGYAKSA